MSGVGQEFAGILQIAFQVVSNLLGLLASQLSQFHGLGPHSFSPRFTWPYYGLIIGTDPVAVDATGAQIMTAKRRDYFETERPFTPPTHHTQYADARYGLGNADPEKIDLVRLGWDEEALI